MKALPLTLTENALLVLRKRILARDVHGQISETPDEMFRRVARSIAAADLEYGSAAEVAASEQDFYEIMSRLEFLPNSPTLMNAGRDLGQLSACFVLPIEDSMESIFGTLADTALIQKSGGGTGFSFSRLRPKDDPVQSTHGQSSGPVSFIRLYNFATEVTKLGGKRAGANMAIMRIDHPDIEEFIGAKANPVELNTFNISVAITDAFMDKVKVGRQYDLLNPRTGGVVGHLDAREIFDRIVEAAWRNGEPGVIFIDRINRDNPTPEFGEIESTNPCGEQPLLPYESCVLGSINLSRFADGGDIDYDHLKDVVTLGVHLLDNVIDVSRFPIPRIEQMTRANRKIGLGVMGWADLLIRMGIPYNSEAAVNLANEVMSFISRHAAAASVELARKRGPFPRWYQESMYQKGAKPAQRNATVTTVAPTGTISLIANCSSGIEPIYAIAYRRISFGSESLLFAHEQFEEYSRKHGFYSDSLINSVAQHASLKAVSGIPPEAAELFVTTHDIPPEWHVRTQAAFQNHIDAAVSKTINFPNDATTDDVKAAYELAYELGCKGITVYRDASREQQVLSSQATHSTAPPFPVTSPIEIEKLQGQLLEMNLCPDCQSQLQRNGGCLYCTCGYSVCVQT
ncbi:MAG TPA: adenosylcobalamin-dependent ribonucleoside-diphosphate reductase [Blastocatellia bacterium]|nr:adenosylcobalamin-dependent ribonucleoside-diphosphate reductase [Blastocatellia bacterium]